MGGGGELVINIAIFIRLAGCFDVNKQDHQSIGAPKTYMSRSSTQTDGPVCLHKLRLLV